MNIRRLAFPSILVVFLILSASVYGQGQIQVYGTLSPYGLLLNKENVDFERYGIETNDYLTTQFFTLGVSDLYKENVTFSIEASIQKSSFNGVITNIFPSKPPNEFERISSKYKLTNISSRIGIRLYYIFLSDKKFNPLFGGGLHLRQGRKWIEEGISTYKNFDSQQTKEVAYKNNIQTKTIQALYDIRFGFTYAINRKLSFIAVLEFSGGLMTNTITSFNRRVNKYELAIPITLNYQF